MGWLAWRGPLAEVVGIIVQGRGGHGSCHPSRDAPGLLLVLRGASVQRQGRLVDHRQGVHEGLGCGGCVLHDELPPGHPLFERLAKEGDVTLEVLMDGRRVFCEEHRDQLMGAPGLLP